MTVLQDVAVRDILAGLTLPAPGQEVGILLPGDFWSRRPVLGHIRQAAHNRARSADVVLHGVLARVAGAVPHTLKLPAIVGSRAPLCYFAAVVGPPASGKSSAFAVATELVLAGTHVVDQLPIGSGEGLVEVLFENVRELDGATNKVVTVKRQTRHNVIIYVDEGETLTALGQRSGSTTLATLRSIWNGHPLGQANASMDRKRMVPAGQYSYGLVLGLQPALAEPLLADVIAGTPQRFGWAWAIDPTIPDQAPPWPGELEWQPPRPEVLDCLRSLSGGGFVTHELPVADSVTEEIRARSLAASRGEIDVEPHEGHSHLLRLKVSALLALLDGRVEVTENDWDLAGIVTDTSSAVRRHVQWIVEASARQREEATAERMARRSVISDTAVIEHRVAKVAERIRALVTENHPQGVGVRAVQRRMSTRQGEVFAESLALAVERRWVVEIDEPGQGSDRRVLRLPDTER